MHNGEDTFPDIERCAVLAMRRINKATQRTLLHGSKSEYFQIPGLSGFLYAANEADT
jgi:hypothetical protein